MQKGQLSGGGGRTAWGSLNCRTKLYARPIRMSSAPATHNKQMYQFGVAYGKIFGTMARKSVLSQHLSRLGKKGGKATAEKLTPEQRSQSARKAAVARWAKWRAERKAE